MTIGEGAHRRSARAGSAHGEVFGNIRPANTLVEAKLVAGRLVEIEADAIIGARPDAATGG